MIAKLAALGLDWAEFKVFISHSTAISHDAMHIIVGVIAQLILAAFLRKSLASPWPWMIVLLLQLTNEWNDLHVERWTDQAMQYGEMAKDIALTMVLPTLLLILSRWCPRLMRRD